MRRSDQLLVALLLACTIFFAGCDTSQPQSTAPYANDVAIGGRGDNRSVGRPECTIMICNNSEEGWLDGWWFRIFGTPFGGGYFSEGSLYQGSCNFTNMTAPELSHLMQQWMADPNVATLPVAASDQPGKGFIRSFMYGQGPTFAEFDEANSYCTNNMTMAMKWISWDSLNPELPPYIGEMDWEARIQRSRAECYLRADVMPVYMFYTNSTPSAMDPDRMEQFANNFRIPALGDDEQVEVGPVVICPEFSYNLTKPGVRDNLVESIRRIRSVCSKCLVMLAPPEEDMDALSNILDDPTNDYEMNTTVDIIGQAWTLNNGSRCEKGLQRQASDKFNFSKNILAKYHKPTLWILMGSNSSNYENDCNWSANDVATAIDSLYFNTPALVSSGGIGMAEYQLLDWNKPYIECYGDNCSYGIIDSNEIQKYPQFNMWVKRCSQYYDVQARDETGQLILENMTQTPLVYNYWGDNGTVCDVISKLGTYKMQTVTTGAEDLGTSPLPKPVEAFSCDRCYGNMSGLRQYWPFEADPSNWYGYASPYYNDLFRAINWSRPSGITDPSSTFNDPNYCNINRISIRKHSEIACKWEMDPLFTRAVALMDSGFDRCTVRYVPISDTSCNQRNIIGPPHDTVGPITDPSGNCQPTSTEMFVDTRDRKCKVRSSITPATYVGEQCKPCTFGLMLCNQTPYRWGTDPFYTYPTPQYTASQPNGCGPTFNPFDTQMGLCCGLNGLCDSIDKAATWAYNAQYVDAQGNLAYVRNALLLGPNPDNWFSNERDKWTILLLGLTVYYHNDPSQDDVNAILDADFAHWQRTKWCPNSITVGYPWQGSPSGPSKTFIWTYCRVVNSTGGIWGPGPIPDPWYECTAASVPGECSLDCCREDTADVSMFASDPERLGWLDVNGNGDANDEYMNACLTDEECCTGDACNYLVGRTYPYPSGGYPGDPRTYRCNKEGSCCGGSFMEHLCCREPYACQVLSYYNATIQKCDKGGFCRKDCNGIDYIDC